MFCVYATRRSIYQVSVYRTIGLLKFVVVPVNSNHRFTDQDQCDAYSIVTFFNPANI